jgi:sugar phosphate permease
MKTKFPYRYRVLIFLFTLFAITYLDRICMVLVGVRMKKEFLLSETQWGLVTGAFALAYALFEIPSGMLGDIKGQRSTLMRIVIWWSLFTALTGLTTGLISLVIVRFLFGMGEAGAFPNGSAVVSRWFPASESSLGVSTIMAGQCFGSAIAPLIVVPLMENFGWRSAFFVNALIGLVWVAVCFYWFRNNPSEARGISTEEKTFIETNRRIGSHSETIPWKIIFKSRNLLALALSFFCSQWNIYFLVAWLPKFLQQGRHFSEKDMMVTTSIVFIPAIITSLLGGVLSDWLIKKKGLKFGRRFSGVFGIATMAVLVVTEATTSNNTILIVCLCASMIFQMIYAFSAAGVCVDISGKHTGRIAGIMNFFGQTGALFMTVIFGKIVDLTHGNFNAPLFVIAPVLLVGSLLFSLVDPTKKLALEHAEEQIKVVVTPGSTRHIKS